MLSSFGCLRNGTYHSTSLKEERTTNESKANWQTWSLTWSSTLSLTGFSSSYLGSKTPRNHIIGAPCTYFPVCANRTHWDGGDEGDGSWQKYLQDRHDESGLADHPVGEEEQIETDSPGERAKMQQTTRPDWPTILKMRRLKVENDNQGGEHREVMKNRFKIKAGHYPFEWTFRLPKYWAMCGAVMKIVWR